MLMPAIYQLIYTPQLFHATYYLRLLVELIAQVL
jgi:hypothetical protein